MFSQFGDKVLDACVSAGRMWVDMVFTLTAGSPSLFCRKVGMCTGKFCDFPMLYLWLQTTPNIFKLKTAPNVLKIKYNGQGNQESDSQNLTNMNSSHPITDLSFTTSTSSFYFKHFQQQPESKANICHKQSSQLSRLSRLLPLMLNKL